MRYLPILLLLAIPVGFFLGCDDDSDELVTITRVITPVPDTVWVYTPCEPETVWVDCDDDDD